MKTKLFENIGNNKFKLLTEAENPDKMKPLRSGIKKIFSSNGNSVSYKQIEGIGFGYIKDVMTAKRCALQEARDVAPSLGFVDHPETGTFIKEVDWNDEESYKRSHGDTFEHDEEDMSNPEEKREVQIGKEILDALDNMNVASTSGGLAADIAKLAQELIDMHSSGGSVTKPGTGGKALYKRGSVY